VALDSLNRVLVDTVDALVTTIARAGIRTVRVYPSVKGGVDEFGDTLIYLREYTMSFRPDSSCPPSGDTIADSRAFRDTLAKMMQMGDANGPWRTRREFMAAGWRDLSGNVRWVITASGNACSVDILLDSPPTWAAGEYPVAYAHVHVQNTGEWVNGCKDWAPTDSGQATPNKQGGGSAGDWEAATRYGRRVYAYSKEGFLSRLDPNTPEGAWEKNKNRWRRGVDGCFTKLP
jgi:hypothetical protein